MLAAGLGALVWFGRGPPAPAPFASPERAPAVVQATKAAPPARGVPAVDLTPGLDVAAGDGSTALPAETEARETHAVLLAHDPELAAAFAASLPPGPMQSELLGRSLTAWATADCGAAIAWARALPEGPARHVALLHLLPAWERADLDGLLEFASALPAHYGQFQAVLAGRLAREHPEGVLAWIGLLDRSPGREPAAINVAAIWAAASPAEAAAHLVGLPDDDVRRAGTLAAVSAWASRDAAAAERWVGALPDGTLRDQALDRLAFWTARRAARENLP